MNRNRFRRELDELYSCDLARARSLQSLRFAAVSSRACACAHVELPTLATFVPSGERRDVVHVVHFPPGESYSRAWDGSL